MCFYLFSYIYRWLRLQSAIFNPWGTRTRIVRLHLPRTVEEYGTSTRRVPSTVQYRTRTVYITPPHHEYSTSTVPSPASTTSTRTGTSTVQRLNLKTYSTVLVVTHRKINQSRVLVRELSINSISTVQYCTGTNKIHWKSRNVLNTKYTMQYKYKYEAPTRHLIMYSLRQLRVPDMDPNLAALYRCLF